MAKDIESKWTRWRLAWFLLAVFAIAELAATLLFWTYVFPTASAQPFSLAILPALLGIASLWSYVVFAFILYGLQRAAAAPGI